MGAGAAAGDHRAHVSPEGVALAVPAAADRADTSEPGVPDDRHRFCRQHRAAAAGRGDGPAVSAGAPRGAERAGDDHHHYPRTAPRPHDGARVPGPFRRVLRSGPRPRQRCRLQQRQVRRPGRRAWFRRRAAGAGPERRPSRADPPPGRRLPPAHTRPVPRPALGPDLRAARRPGGHPRPDAPGAGRRAVVPPLVVDRHRHLAGDGGVPYDGAVHRLVPHHGVADGWRGGADPGRGGRVPRGVPYRDSGILRRGQRPGGRRGHRAARRLVHTGDAAGGAVHDAGRAQPGAGAPPGGRGEGRRGRRRPGPS